MQACHRCQVMTVMMMMVMVVMVMVVMMVMMVVTLLPTFNPCCYGCIVQILMPTTQTKQVAEQTWVYRLQKNRKCRHHPPARVPLYASSSIFVVPPLSPASKWRLTFTLAGVASPGICTVR